VSDAYRQLLEGLLGHRCAVKEIDDGKAMAQCPAHDDRTPSLSIGLRNDGKGVVIYCQAGCQTPDIVAALHLQMSDLFDDPKMQAAYDGHATYTYPGGRKVHRENGKKFWQDGDKQDRSLFGAERITDDTNPIYVPEGEKDVQAAQSIGAVAVCSAMGAGKAHKADWSPLAGHDVIVVADRDEPNSAGKRPGRDHALEEAELLGGIATLVQIVEAAVGKDLADHIAAGRTLDELVPVDWWPADNEDGAELLDDIREVVAKFCVLPGKYESIAVVLWVVLTHLLEKFDYAPRLHIRAPEKRSGKTRLLTIIKGLVYSPLPTANCTTAYIYRSIGNDRPPTLLFDEVDALFGSKKAAENNEDLRALLNAGAERDAPVGRTIGPNHTPQEFNTFAMAALTGIGRLPDTIEDRAVVLAMKRRTRGEKVASYRKRRDEARLHELRTRIITWADAVREKAGAEYPDLPIDDRAADIWEPLVTVADLAGGHWPELARAAAVALSAESAEDDSQSLNIKLLNDIETLLVEGAIGGFIKSADLCEKLRKLDESPWEDMMLTPPKLGRRLADNFRIRTRHSADRKGRGYHLADFFDAFTRYPCPTLSNPVPHTPEQHKRSENLHVQTPSPTPFTDYPEPNDVNGEQTLPSDCPSTGDQGVDGVVDGVRTCNGEKGNPSSETLNTGLDWFGRGDGENSATDEYCWDCGTELTEAAAGYCTECTEQRESSDE
jgi:hypothetical protein